MRRNSENLSLFHRFLYYMTPWDGRFEDLKRGSIALNIFRDFTAGLIVAMVAIPLAMGFAMASGLRPEQGIVGGAVAGLIGALFGGSKYQVYGPTAAFIPLIAALVGTHGYEALIVCSLAAGVILMLLGLARAGSIVARVPQSIVVGFTIGIAVVIATSQIGELLGLKAKLGTTFFSKVSGIVANLGELNLFAIALGLATFFMTRSLLRVSPFLPAPLIALGVATLVSATTWANKGLVLVQDRFGAIPTNFLVLTAPSWPKWSFDLIYFTAAIVFVAAVESLLCSRMADRLAGNKGRPFDPNKELWGQGLVNSAVVLFNGFPHTGALARTATNIKVGALSPLAGIFKFALKLVLAAYLASVLQIVPMACLAGILLFVASGMVKKAEVTEVWAEGSKDRTIMITTAVMVVLVDFLVGVVSGLVVWGVLSRFGRKSQAEAPQADGKDDWTCLPEQPVATPELAGLASRN